MNVTFFVVTRKHRVPLWLDRARVLTTAALLVVLYHFADPTKSAVWVMLLLPFFGQVQAVERRREANWRFALFSAVTLEAFLWNYPFHGDARAHSHWLAVSLVKVIAVIGLAACARLVRNHDRQQRRALTAAFYKLAQKQKHLVQTERFAALGELSTGVAHEVNNSLTVVVAGLEEIARHVDEQKADWEGLRKHTDRMGRAVHRIERIVRQLRLLSRDARRDPPQLFDLRETVDDALFMTREQLSTRNIRWEVQLPETAVPVVGHPNELSQVLMNLINNARDALEGHPIRRLCIRVRAQGERALVEVEDSGPGIPAEVQDRLFIPFVTTKPVGRGTGLGLSVSYGIVKRHAGALTYESSPSGTVFRLELPLASEAQAA